MTGVSGPQYVFIDGPCSRYLCMQTDINCFRQQGESPSSLDIDLLQKYSQQLTALQRTVRNYVDKLSGVDAEDLQVVSDVGFPVLQQIAGADNPTDYTNSLFHLSTLTSLLKYARDFAKSGRTRPFFDFCMSELNFFFGQAAATDIDLMNAFTASSMLHANPIALDDFRQWPEACNYHEPGFGKQQLNILRSMGPAMQKCLGQPFSVDMLHQCVLAMRNVDQYSRPTPTTLAPPSTPAVSTTLAAVSPVETGINANFAAWLSQQEAAFVAQLKKTAAKEEKRVMRQDRIANLSPVRITMDPESVWVECSP